jgi:prepilin-type N-terminal cleavage/methylation domain-containing protein
MNKHKGFTLIELMIVIAIILILAAIAFPAYQEHNNPTTSEQKYTQCINGVKFTTANTPTQIIGEDGRGISCNNDSTTSNSAPSDTYNNTFENTWNN